MKKSCVTKIGDNERQRAIAEACFVFVRDQIKHSGDALREDPSSRHAQLVTYRASEVLLQGCGYCYAKSHLLAALLRANGIAAALCYQRLSVDDTGPPYSLHGLNAVWLTDVGWYRIDARGNKAGVDAQFGPPQERLAFNLRQPAERDLPGRYVTPLPVVVESLTRYNTAAELAQQLPDLAD